MPKKLVILQIDTVLLFEILKRELQAPEGQERAIRMQRWERSIQHYMWEQRN